MASRVLGRRWLVTWIQWPSACHSRDRLDRVRVGLGGEDVLVRVGLLDAVRRRASRSSSGRSPSRAAPRRADRRRSARATTRRRSVPVVVQRRVDVQRDPGHVRVPYAAMAKTILALQRAPRPAQRAPRAPTPSYGATAEPDWRDDRLARRTCTGLEVDGTRMNYVDIGSTATGPPVVFIHGLAGQLAELAREHPALRRRSGACIAMDLPGLRATRRCRASRSRSRATAASVDALCDQLGSAACVVVGNSMGGFVDRRAGDPVPGAGRAAVLVVGGGHLDHEPRAAARPARPAACIGALGARIGRPAPLHRHAGRALRQLRSRLRGPPSDPARAGPRCTSRSARAPASRASSTRSDAPDELRLPRPAAGDRAARR